MPRTRAVTTREKDAQALALRRSGLGYAQIAERLGYRAQSSAHEAVQRALKDAREDIGRAAQIELDRLDDALRTAYQVMLGRHVKVSNAGSVVRDSDGQPMLDRTLNLAGAQTVVRISESRRKLLGLDAPSRKVVEVITQDVVDDEIRRLCEEVAANGGDVSALIREVAADGVAADRSQP